MSGSSVLFHTIFSMLKNRNKKKQQRHRRSVSQKGGAAAGVSAALFQLGMLSVDAILELIEYYKKKGEKAKVRKLTKAYEDYLRSVNSANKYKSVFKKSKQKKKEMYLKMKNKPIQLKRDRSTFKM